MALIRAGLAACISRERDIEVVAELDRREPVLPTVAALRPDVAVIDDGIAADDGFAVIKDLHNAAPFCRTLVMATQPRLRDLRQAVAPHPRPSAAHPGGGLPAKTPNAPAGRPARATRPARRVSPAQGRGHSGPQRCRIKLTPRAA